MNKLDEEITTLLEWLDKWLIQWKELHSRYEKTPGSTQRQQIRKSADSGQNGHRFRDQTGQFVGA